MISRRILVAPLDWGLGHGTRCIPVIRQLLAGGHEVFLGGSGPSLKLLQEEFPSCQVLPLPGYDVHYSLNGSLIAALLWQVPRLMKVVKEEHAVVRSAINSLQLDAVISDNRYGLWSESVPSVIITHQLHLQAPAFIRPVAQAVNKRFINRFHECWVPDYAESPGLAGQLSHPPLKGTKTYYLGPLSRFTRSNPATKHRYDLAVILSGPEPQRSRLEEIVVRQAVAMRLKTAVVQGQPGAAKASSDASVDRFEHLDAVALADLLQSSRLVVSRAGYSSIMDYHALEKDAILVPTPGQPEQEYLAGEFLRRKQFYSVEQESFHLSDAVVRKAGYKISVNRQGANLDSHLSAWLERISSL